MNLISLSKLQFSTTQGWPELEKIHPGLLKVFALVVLPLSLLPPVMLYYAGTSDPKAFLKTAADKAWGEIAVIFFSPR